MAKRRPEEPDCRVSFPGAQLVFRQRNHALWKYKRAGALEMGDTYVAINCMSGFTDYPLRVGEGERNVLYDRPEAFPKAVRARKI